MTQSQSASSWPRFEVRGLQSTSQTQPPPPPGRIGQVRSIVIVAVVGARYNWPQTFVSFVCLFSSFLINEYVHRRRRTFFPIWQVIFGPPPPFPLFHNNSLAHVSRVMISYLLYSCVVDDRAWCIHLKKIEYAPIQVLIRGSLALPCASLPTMPC